MKAFWDDTPTMEAHGGISRNESCEYYSQREDGKRE